ncbi:MAG TPA: PH domain-containing protein [Pilimelia sp.]|nr:PH domain-containing protein [Pilimelia sp.]
MDDGGAVEDVRWRVRPALPGAKVAAAVAFGALAAVVGDDPVRLALAAVATTALLLWAARDLLAPARLTADATGVTVIAGFAGRRHLPWSTIERVRVDRRTRGGLRAELLELDAGETLHLFSEYELSARPADVAARLAELRQGAQA